MIYARASAKNIVYNNLAVPAFKVQTDQVGFKTAAAACFRLKGTGGFKELPHLLQVLLFAAALKDFNGKASVIFKLCFGIVKRHVDKGCGTGRIDDFITGGCGRRIADNGRGRSF